MKYLFIVEPKVFCDLKSGLNRGSRSFFGTTVAGGVFNRVVDELTLGSPFLGLTDSKRMEKEEIIYPKSDVHDI